MAVLNRIVNILILLLVITAGVFSYMLYSKRENFTKGMENMAAAIQKTAAKLAEGTGNTEAKGKLTKDSLDHKKGPAFNNVLPELEKAASDVIKQRDILAEAIAKAGAALGTEIKNDSLRSITSYPDSAKTLDSAVNSYKASANGVRKKYVELGKYLGARDIKDDSFDHGKNYNVVAERIMKAAENLKNENKRRADDINTVTKSLGLKAYKVNNSSEWKESLNKKVNEFKQTESKRKEYESQAKDLAKKVKNQDETIKKLNGEIAKLKEKNGDLQSIINDDGKVPVPKVLLKSDSPECFEYVKGKVTYVNKEYGFVQVSIGKNYEIKQQYGTIDNRVLFPLPSGVIMTVSRGVGENARGVAKIRVKNVNNHNSICNVIKGNVADINVGDDVFFGKDDRALIPASERKN